LCNGDEAEPTAPAEGGDLAAFAQQLSKYQVRVARVKSILLQMVSTSQLHIIAQQRLQTPRDMWNELVGTFERPSLSNKLQLQTRLLDLTMEPGSSVDCYFKQLQDLTERLAALGAPVESDFQVALLLRGLPSEYNALRIAFVAKGTVSMSELREALRTEECHLNSDTGSVGASGSTVLSARGSDRNRNRGKQPPRMNVSPGSCYGCGKYGHIHRECPINPYVPPSHKPKGKAAAKYKVKQAEYCVNDATDDAGDTEAMFTALYGARVESNVSSNVWIIDSGATKHMSPCYSLFVDYVPFRVHESVSLGNGAVCDALGIGRVAVTMLCEGTVKHYTLSDVLYVPCLVNNFFSVTAATLKGHEIMFKEKQCRVHRNGELVVTGHCANHVWYIDCVSELDDACANLKTDMKVNDLILWHQRLGHVNEKRLKSAVTKHLINGVDCINGDLPFCEACVQGKQARKPFKGSCDVQTTAKLQLVHSDVCGPMSVSSVGGARYFVSFTDDFTRYSRVYFMKQKSEVFEKFKQYEAEVTNTTGQNIKTLRTDNGGEYTSAEFEAYLRKRGIRHELSCPHTPQQNGVSERLNRTLQEMGLSQLLHSALPRCFWADSLATACYVRNRLPVCPLNVSPHEKWYGKKPSVKHMRVFGCVAYALKPDGERKKMTAKSEKMRFIGYPFGTKGYRLYDEQKHRVVVRRDVVFNEADFGKQQPVVDPVDVRTTESSEDNSASRPTISVGGSSAEEPVSGHVVESTEPHMSTELRRSNRQTKKPERYGEWVEYTKSHSLAEATDQRIQHCLYYANICEPQTIDEALRTPEAAEWKKAADDEMKALETMNAWKLVPLPEGKKPVGCRWVFKVKNRPDGAIERFKARLVAKGYSQKPGVDFSETFAPVVRLNTLRSLLAFAVKKKLIIHQMDVNTAFLNGHLEDEVYMEQPPGYVSEGQEDLVCHLQRSLYGLKQAPRCWNSIFCKHMRELGFTQLQSDCCIFKKDQPLVFVALYVDDIIPVAENDEVMNKTKKDLMQRFEMKDMGPLHHILGINCIQDVDNGRLGLSQELYIDKLIHKYNLTEANSVSTPSDPNVTLMKDDGVSKPVNQSLYQSLIGSLLYAALGTRPDIQFAVSAVAKYSSKPNQSHLTAALRILRYLKKTKHLILWYEQNDDKVVGFSDADYARDVDDRHSTSGYVFVLGSGAISWYSGKQKGVTTSTAQAEYVALSHTTKEAVFLRQLLSELEGTDYGPISVQEDNQAAIAIAKNPVFHSKAKHIDICYHFTREAIVDRQIVLEYCNTNDMTADILTKPVVRSRFEKLCSKLGLSD